MVSSSSSLLSLINEGKFENALALHHEEISNPKSSKTLEHILLKSSQFVYNERTIPVKQMSVIIEIVVTLLSSNKDVPITVLPKILQCLNCIYVNAVKKGMVIDQTLALVKTIDEFSERNSEFVRNQPKVMKKLFIFTWNLGMEGEMSDRKRLNLKVLAICFLIQSENDVSESCSRWLSLSKWAIYKKCPLDLIKDSYNMFLQRLNDRLSHCDGNVSDILVINQVVLDYIFILKESNLLSELDSVLSGLQKNLEKACSTDLVKMLKKVFEFLENVCSNKIDRNLLTEVTRFQKAIPFSQTNWNGLVVENLIFVLQWILKEGNPQLEVNLLHCISKRVGDASSFSTSTFESVLNEFDRFLRELVKQLSGNFDEDRFREFSKFLPDLTHLFPVAVGRNCYTQIHNLGIHLSNLGVLAFKKHLDALAADCLTVALRFLKKSYEMAKSDKKHDVEVMLKKKCVILKDSLRFCGRYQEAVGTTLDFASCGFLPVSEVVRTWVKCKRDSSKTEENTLRALCIKDMIALNKELKGEVKFDCDQMLLEEVTELAKLGQDTAEDEKTCAMALISSGSFFYRMEGYLALARVLWFHPGQNQDHKNSSTAMAVNQAQNCIQNYSKEINCDASLLMEMKARTLFWSYLCHLQIVQELAKDEIERKQMEEDECPQPSSVPLGEEADPNDNFERRPSAPNLVSFSVQETVLKYIYQSLQAWASVIEEGGDVKNASAACVALLSTAFIFKLAGIVPPLVQCLSFLTTVAHKYDLKTYWIKGITELMGIVPEMISSKVSERIHSLLTSPPENQLQGFPEYFKAEALASVAYYYYRIGEYSKSGQIIMDLMNLPLMDKKTPQATQVQIVIHTVASQLAYLPRSMWKDKEMRPKPSSLSLAIAGARKAIALVAGTTNRSSYDVICWHHEVAWLHYRINSWLVQLCLLTAQPRLARAYLGLAVLLSEKMALPLRTSEWLCLLAEVDLQCEQLDDCRVKMDSLDRLLIVHSSVQMKEVVEKFPKLFVKSNSTIKTAKGKTESKARKATKELAVQPCLDQIPEAESMREGRVSPLFTIDPVPLDLGSRYLVVGDPKRIKDLASTNPLNEGPSSPSFQYRADLLSRSVVCNDGLNNCNVCSSPQLQIVAVKAKMIMGVINAHRNNPKAAVRYLMKARNDLQRVLDVSADVTSKILSSFSVIPDEVPFVCPDQSRDFCFLASELAPMRLSLLFNNTEVLAMDPNEWGQLEVCAEHNLQQVNKMPSHILARNHTIVLQLILQAKSIEKVKIEERNVDSQESSLKESSEDFSSPLRSFSSPSFRTPLKSSVRTCLWKRPLGKNKAVKPVVTPFKIYTDNSKEKTDNIPTQCDPSNESRKISEQSSPDVIETSPEYKNGTPSIATPCPKLFKLPASTVKTKPAITRAGPSKKQNGEATTSLTRDRRTTKASTQTQPGTATVNVNTTSNPKLKVSKTQKTTSNVTKESKSSCKPKKDEIDAKTKVTRSTRSNLKRL